MKNLKTTFPRITNFCMFPKIHKESTQGRPIGNSIGSITEKTSAYIDGRIRPQVPSIPTFVKDTIYFINLILGRKLKEEDLLMTIDITSLYTSVPHNEGITATHQSLAEVQHQPPTENINM